MSKPELQDEDMSGWHSPGALKASEVFQGLAWDDVAASPQTRPVLHRPAASF